MRSQLLVFLSLASSPYASKTALFTLCSEYILLPVSGTLLSAAHLLSFLSAVVGAAVGVRGVECAVAADVTHPTQTCGVCSESMVQFVCVMEKTPNNQRPVFRLP